VDILFLLDLLVQVVVVEEISLQVEVVEVVLVELTSLLFLLALQFHLILLPVLVLEEDLMVAGVEEMEDPLAVGVMRLEEEELEQVLNRMAIVLVMVLVVQDRVE
jgi:hypothetical protein